MASETPDPSSSELLTDFDIADVDNWDDQNDSSKNEELMKSSASYVPSTSIHSLHSPIQGHLSGQQLPIKIGIQSNISSMTNLKQFQPHLLQRPPLQNQTFTTNQQQAVGHEYAKIHNHSQEIHDNSSHSPTTPEKEVQRTGPAQQKTTQSGQALETLRALALAQEEQVRKLKQGQEQASQIQQQLKLVSSSSQQSESNATPSPVTTIQETLQTPTGSKTTHIPLTTLKLPITDPKGQSGKQNSILQLRGQLIRTPDQKLMLVTEFGGKKVGYLIGSQSGQLATTNTSVASQLIAKTSQGIGQFQPKLKNVMSTHVSSPSSPAQNNVHALSTLERPITEEPKTILDSIDESSNDSSRHLIAKEDSIIVSSDEDSGSLADVSLGLKNATLDGTTQSEQKKRKGKMKKKKDKNEPVKPISPYLMFFKDTHPSVHHENPGASIGEVSKMVSKLWEQLGTEEKQVYLDRSTKAKEEYQVRLAEYKASLTVSADSPVDRSLNPDDTHTNSSPDAVILDIDASSTKRDAGPISVDDDENETIVVSSSDSSPEGSLKKQLDNSRTADSSAIITDEETSMDVDNSLSDRVQSEDLHSDASSPLIEPVVRKRGRPKLSKNKKPSLKLPKAKKGKKADTIGSREPEKPLKLTMKINIKDSKITESPTKAFAEVGNITMDEKLHDGEDEEMDEKDGDEKKPSTQPKSLLGFKIPKKQRSSTEDVKNETLDRPSKPSPSGFRKCFRSNCEKAAKISKERGPSYCSNKCLVFHCRNVFDTWVDERKLSLNKD